MSYTGQLNLVQESIPYWLCFCPCPRLHLYCGLLMDAYIIHNCYPSKMSKLLLQLYIFLIGRFNKHELTTTKTSAYTYLRLETSCNFEYQRVNGTDIKLSWIEIWTAQDYLRPLMLRIALKLLIVGAWTWRFLLEPSRPQLSPSQAALHCERNAGFLTPLHSWNLQYTVENGSQSVVILEPVYF